MRLPLSTLAGALIVGFAALSAPAQAGGLAFPADGFEDGPRRFDRSHGGPRIERPWGHGPRSFERSGDGFGPRHFGPRHVGPHHGGPRHAWGGPHAWGGDCVVRVNRYFDGFAWVSERRRVCR